MRAKVSGAELTTFFNLVKNTNEEYLLQPLSAILKKLWSMRQAPKKGCGEKVFLPDLQRRRRAEEKPDAPALLYVDGHSSRANPKVLRLLREANVSNHLCYSCISSPPPLDKSFSRAGLRPIDPEQVFHPATDSLPEPRRRRSRKSFNINGIVLTSEEVVAGLEEEKQAIKSAKKRAEKKNKPQSHDQNHTATQVDEEMQPNEQ
ncbi:MAG: hypothetical protein K2Q09_09540 [Phycisphaerales bacterium]|nr:hypothetical protein [Phycisphaerales bacterium]